MASSHCTDKDKQMRVDVTEGGKKSVNAKNANTNAQLATPAMNTVSITTANSLLFRLPARVIDNGPAQAVVGDVDLHEVYRQ